MNADRFRMAKRLAPTHAVVDGELVGDNDQVGYDPISEDNVGKFLVIEYEERQKNNIYSCANNLDELRERIQSDDSDFFIWGIYDLDTGAEVEYETTTRFPGYE